MVKRKANKLTINHKKFIALQASGMSVVDAFKNIWANSQYSSIEIKRFGYKIAKTKQAQAYYKDCKKELETKIINQILTKEAEKITWTRDQATVMLLELANNLMDDFRINEVIQNRVSISKAITNITSELNKLYNINFEPYNTPSNDITIINDILPNELQTQVLALNDAFNSQ